VTALLTGCFDILHVGHVRLIAGVRGTLGADGTLAVGINSDASYERIRGCKPCVPQDERMEILQALADVDWVVVFPEDNACRLIRRTEPDYWVKGGDYVGRDVPELSVCRDIGCQAVFVPFDQTCSEGLSSTKLREAVMSRGKA
jgi:rfaE bifunctional protein nucleotidyltransferase chain/domain